MNLNIQDTFNKELPSDPISENSRRQVSEACFSYVTPKVPSQPKLVHVSEEVADLLGISKEDIKSEDFLQTFTGAKVLDGTRPYAMCYGGHQFGNWAGQLGDGRAINLTEVMHDSQRWALQLKGAGPTPYSRSADGLAVLRSSVREHLCSEAMHHLGVPTTRSLSLSLSGDKVMRDVMYDGNPALEKGAIVCRVSPSFIRFGSFEIFASRQDIDNLKKLADYTIKHFYPEIKLGNKDAYVAFFNAVLDRTLEMVVHWQRVGFVHGVMNTDNLSILGLTIDYGPYGWLENYDEDWTPNTTDRTNRRYRFGHQPQVALWNLYQLANSLYPLVEASKPFEEALERYKITYEKQYLKMMRSKLGFDLEMENDSIINQILVETFPVTETDMTIFFRLLANVQKQDTEETMVRVVQDAFYESKAVKGEVLESWKSWFKIYKGRLASETLSDDERKSKMNLVNPKYVLRNYMAQLAIDEANKGNYELVAELYTMLKKPYEEQSEYQKWFAKRPEWARHKVGCSMLSCSS